MITHPRQTGPTSVYLEAGEKRVFACAVEWPGWCRSGRGEERALQALAAYAERYAPVALEAGLPFPATGGDAFSIAERLPGSAGYTDFGAPGAVAGGDAQPMTGEDAERMTALVVAC